MTWRLAIQDYDMIGIVVWLWKINKRFIQKTEQGPRQAEFCLLASQ
jgi:hypothetical protein